MQITSSIEPVPGLDHIVEEPGRHRPNRHEPRMCAACARPLAGQEAACWGCGTRAPEPVRRAVPRTLRAVPEAPIGGPLATPASATLNGRTPLWTRHTVGAIEATRDARLERRGHAPIRYRTAPRAQVVARDADFDGDRWVDEGGSFEHEAAALRVVQPRR